ncbi:heat shock 22 kDa protein, mitochondrial-like [Cornus florida]|uniref:heat shock 22 kDa protein, mitochondrial-like n=1 Tax=Cornus florida TaxID=4283 RepID=UPI00289962FC|nr:heat shock 22 kDa protein, mitochondrial-like [Cornus florida]
MASSRALTSTLSLVRMISPLNASPVLVRSFGSSARDHDSEPEHSDSDHNSDSDSENCSGSDSDCNSESDEENNSDSNSDSESDGSDYSHTEVAPPPEVCGLVNPFLKDGPAIPFNVMKTDEAMYARLNVPGIGKEGLKMWVEDDALHVKGAEVVDDPRSPLAKDGPRNYSGDIDLPERYKAAEIDAELKNGVLKITVPLEEKKDVINVKVK